jgi:hypothetical protein
MNLNSKPRRKNFPIALAAAGVWSATAIAARPLHADAPGAPPPPPPKLNLMGGI